MRPPVIVGLLPPRDHLPGLSEAPKQLTRKALVAETAVEALHETVLPWAARFDVRRAHVNHIEE